MEWVWDGVGVGWSGWHGACGMEVCEMECVGMEGVWDGVGVGWSGCTWDGVYIEMKHAWDGVCVGWDEGV